MVEEKRSDFALRNQTTMELIAEREIVITRTFNALPPIVFDAWTRAELVRRWWAPKSRGVSMAGCDADVRVGGRYRYALRKDAGGEEIVFSGKYTEITPPARLVYTQALEPYPGEVVVTVTFEERAGKTVLVARELYPSKDVRDAALASGMEHGMRETMDQLDELVATLQRTMR
jgi:uncharacterized protein YndB with AHSA1/START domain